MSLDGVTLLRYAPGTSVRTAVFDGTLNFSDGCTWVDNGRSKAVVLWPSETRLERVDGSLHVVLGQVSVIEGDGVQLGGGAFRREDVGEVERLVGPLPPTCAIDLYWMAGSLSEHITP